MTEKDSKKGRNFRKTGGDSSKDDAHVATPEPYKKLSELPDHASFLIGGELVSKEEGLAAMAKAARSRSPKSTHRKERISIGLSHDVLDAFRATGSGWQSRVNEALREWLKEHR